MIIFLKMLDLIPPDKIKIIEESMTEKLAITREEALKDLEKGHAINWDEAKKELGL